MILDITAIQDIILNNPNKDLVTKAKLNNKKLRMHIYGEGLANEIAAIDGHEKEELKNLRKKYAKSNKDLFARMARPIDKVFSARGGSVYYNMGEAGNKKAIGISTDVKDGLSIRKWIEGKWKPHHLDDPNGLIFMEINSEAVVYPTYKSISIVYDYLPAGSSLEYVVFSVSSSEKVKAGFLEADIIFRVVDDSFDYWVKREDKTVSIIQQHTFPNYFGKVPAVLNSDFVSPEIDGLMLSLFDDIIELADDFIQTGSIRNLAKLRMAYPKYWEYADDCPVCHGTTSFESKPCESCKGTGKNIMVSPGAAKLMTYPDNKDTPIVTPNVAGFVPFPKDYFDYATLEIAEIENMMSLTIWGTETKKHTPGMTGSDGKAVKTATQVIDEIQPKADRLTALSEMAEKRHKFIMDHIIQIAIDSSYKGCSVNYGRRYMIEGPDVIWQRYSDARTKGAAISVLDDLLMEYIEAKYNGDAIGMNIQEKLLVVEPFVHFTVTQVQTMGASFDDYNRKLYYGEWLNTLNDAMLLSFSSDELKQQLTDYVAAKNLKEPEPEKKPNPVLN